METNYFALSEYIPNLDTLYEKLVEYVKEHQGEKGYIDTQECGMDTIYGFGWNEETNRFEEMMVYGVRVVNNDVEIILEPLSDTYFVEYKDEDFKNAAWYSLRWGDVLYVQNLFNIAELIWEYVDENKEMIINGDY